MTQNLHELSRHSCIARTGNVRGRKSSALATPNHVSNYKRIIFTWIKEYYSLWNITWSEVRKQTAKLKDPFINRPWRPGSKPYSAIFGRSSTLVIFYAMFTDHSQSPLLSIRWETLAFFLCLVPLLSLVSCVLIALVWHFDETTRTQCNVSNSIFLCQTANYFSLLRGNVQLFLQGHCESEILKM